MENSKLGPSTIASTGQASYGNKRSSKALSGTVIE